MWLYWSCRLTTVAFCVAIWMPEKVMHVRRSPAIIFASLPNLTHVARTDVRRAVSWNRLLIADPACRYGRYLAAYLFGWISILMSISIQAGEYRDYYKDSVT